MPDECVSMLTEEHRDGRIWADVDNDLWQRHPYEPDAWMVTFQRPMMIRHAEATPHRVYGPFRLVGHAE